MTSGAKPVGGAAMASNSLAFVKGMVVGVVACGAAWGGSHLLSSAEPRSAESPQTVASAHGSHRVAPPATPEVKAIREERPSPLASSTAASGRPRPAVSAPSPALSEKISPPSAAQFGEPERAPSSAVLPQSSELQAEALLLRRARQQLRAGDFGAARQSLEESTARFAAPTLHQEREALTIELLARSGQKSAAAARAREFLSVFPASPHASRVRTFSTP